MKEQFDFVTLFLNATNTELVKDVGQIPYELHRMYDLKTALVSSYVDTNGENLEQVKGISLLHFPIILSHKFSGLLFIILYAKRIKWLNIYHVDKKSLYWARAFKFLNRKGKVYLKLDADYRMCEDFENNLQRRRVLQKCSDMADLVSAESEATRARIQPYVDRKIALISNGFCVGVENSVSLPEKENIFLTVGRLGTEQKATDVLLQAFKNCSNQSQWKLRLVGNVEESFKEYINCYFKENPQLVDRITFTGPITNRESLNQEYRRAKVFLLSSRWESFALVLLEAMANGCKLVATDVIPPIMELTDYGKYGKIVSADNAEQLARAMVEITQEEFDQNIITDIQKYAQQKFSWSSICNNLYELLMKSGNRE